ncbi:MAG TPA: hypothetical protein VHB98_18400, partial [Chloroflexota bacterium]|nr:hypothetical protein [Chloroflexota bacterium]
MALTYDELQDRVYQAFQLVQVDHQRYVPPSNVGPGVVRRAPDGHYEWEFTFDLSTVPTEDQMRALANGMHGALVRILQGTGAQV